MNIRKNEVSIPNKLIIKNKSPKKKELTKAISKKNLKPKKQLIAKLDFYSSKKKSPSKENIFDDNKLKNNIIKKVTKNQIKKRQNKFYKKKPKEKEPSSVNSNLNKLKIINSKLQQSYSITTDSINSYTSNTSHRNSNNKNNINLSHKKKFCDFFKNGRLDSEMSNYSNNRKSIKSNKENKDKIVNKGLTKYLNNNKIKIKDINHISKRINLINPKPIKNNPFVKNILNLPINEFKIENTSKNSKSNMSENISESNRLSNNNIIINNNLDEKNKNISKYLNSERRQKYIFDNTKDKNLQNNETFNKKIVEEDYLNTDKKIYINNKFYDNLIEKTNNTNIIKNNAMSNQIKKEYDICAKKNLNPVKKSLFSEHMNFLFNRQEAKDNNKDNYLFNKNNYINKQFNNILDSSDKKEFESKFINYDLGKTTGSSLSKDSFFILDIKNNNNISKNINLSKIQGNSLNGEEKERTIGEMEKLANEYLNMSEYFENIDEYYK